MKFTSLRPVIWTDAFEETIIFYTQKLAFQIGERNDDWGWASMHKDAVELMIAKPNAHSGFVKPNFTGSFYFVTDDVDRLWNNIRDLVSICYAIEDFEWEMREFAIYDNNGYILQFGQNKDKMSQKRN